MSERTVATSAPAPPPLVDGPLMRSPASRRHAALGAALLLESGWEVQSSYGDPQAERASLLETVGVADVTARGKIDLRGRFEPVVAEEGELAARVADDWTILLREPGPVAERVEVLEKEVGPGAMVTDATHLRAGYVVAGPRLFELWSRVSAFDIADLASGSAAGAPVVEVGSVVVRRDLAVPGVEVYVASEFGRYAWEVLLGVVRALGGGPVGWRALRAEGWS